MLCLGAGEAAARGWQAEQAEDEETLDDRVDVLAEELERMRSGEPEVEMSPEDARQLGLGASAASVYERSETGVSIAGYGEMLYQNGAGTNESGAAVSTPARLDFLRAVFYFGYRFDEKFLFNSEIEVEHANEIGVEFAYLEYLAHPAASFRGGMLLVPMGLTNEIHEPTAFLSAARPETEQRLLPSTWRENGAGIVGSQGPVSYRAYVVNGLNGAGFDASGLRGGRQKGAQAAASDMAFVARADVEVTPGVSLGGSIYYGDSAQGQFSDPMAGVFSVGTTIGEVHGQADVRGFDVRGLWARADLDNTDLLNDALGLTGGDAVGSVIQGGYIQVGYDVLSQTAFEPAVTPFYRFEMLDTQAEVAPGFVRDPARERTFHTFGVSLAPIPNVVVKADYQWITNEAATGVDQFNLALGYNF
jgi:hypothetical protein